MSVKKLIERVDGAAANLGVTLLSIARRPVQLRKQIEGDIRGLIICRISAGNVGAQRADRGVTRERARGLMVRERQSAASRHETRRDRFDVSFHSRNLSREENVGRGS